MKSYLHIQDAFVLFTNIYAIFGVTANPTLGY